MMRPLHEKLNIRREELGLTYEVVQTRLEKQGLSVSVSTVGHWFTGIREPKKLLDLMELCKALDTTLAEIAAEDITYARDETEQLLLTHFRHMTREQRAAYLVMGASIAPKDSKK
jgi:transcriptional regulator with XRE-family HTH domain